ncbi:hypothetical protein AOG2_24820 [Geobacter sp. AOG2]|nr:hypothetical protein AOG2_24820 [Geobacter sp. AOG2]
MVCKSPHRRRNCFRHLSALVLGAIYIVIVLAPLAPMALHFKTVAHAVTGECSGDCAICGCSPETRGKTCCCVRKHRFLEDRAAAAKQGCCATKSTPHAEPAARKPTCCSTKPAPPEPPEDSAALPPCCTGKGKNHRYDGHKEPEQAPDHAVTVLKCGCPCGSGKVFAMSGVSFEILPGSAPGSIPPHDYSSEQLTITHLMNSRHAEPPEPPPKLALFS